LLSPGESLYTGWTYANIRKFLSPFTPIIGKLTSMPDWGHEIRQPNNMSPLMDWKSWAATRKWCFHKCQVLIAHRWSWPLLASGSGWSTLSHIVVRYRVSKWVKWRKWYFQMRLMLTTHKVLWISDVISLERPPHIVPFTHSSDDWAQMEPQVTWENTSNGVAQSLESLIGIYEGLSSAYSIAPNESSSPLVFASCSRKYK
jgi:hypothetical protein